MKTLSFRSILHIALMGISVLSSFRTEAKDLEELRQSLQNAMFSASSIGTYELSHSGFLSGPSLLGYKAKAYSSLLFDRDRDVLEAVLNAIEAPVTVGGSTEENWADHGFKIQSDVDSKNEITILISYKLRKAEIRGIGTGILSVGFDPGIEELLKENTGIRNKDVGPVTELKD